MTREALNRSEVRSGIEKVRDTLSERWARTRYTGLRYYNKQMFVREVRAEFRAIR